MKKLLKHTFIRFALVGAIGFLVDLSSMLLLSIWLPHIVARGLAFWVAASSNWWWNRNITFNGVKQAKDRKTALLQWVQFIGGSMVAFIPNWGCYMALLTLQSSLTNPTVSSLWPYLAMVPGVLIGMIMNYVFSRFWIFSNHQIDSKNAL